MAKPDRDPRGVDRRPSRRGEGDPTDERYIEAAYIAAKSMPDCPQAIKDLFWHVHQRAL